MYLPTSEYATFFMCKPVQYEFASVLQTVIEVNKGHEKHVGREVVHRRWEQIAPFLNKEKYFYIKYARLVPVDQDDTELTINQ